MNLQGAALLWLVVVILVLFLANYFGLNNFAAVVLALLVGMIVFGFAYVPGNWQMALANPSLSGLNGIMALVFLITWLLVLIYLFYKLFTDRKNVIVTPVEIKA